jgi:FixJ family two-component response regulator
MRLAPARVAVVDDDASVRRALARLLGTLDCSVRTYASAEEFLDSLQYTSPDCLIVDLQMPGMTGLELQLHLARAGVRIPTIVITAHGEIVLRRQCEAAGAVAYLLKPFEDGTLVEALRKTTSIL